MKLEIDKVMSVAAAGPARMNCAIVPGGGPLRRVAGSEGSDNTPPAIAVVAMGGGETVKMMLSMAEAIAWGQMLIACACFAEGGPPPVLAPEPPASPLIVNGGRA